MAGSEVTINQTPQEQAQDPARVQLSSANWIEELKAAEQNSSKWRESARKITRRFLDRRESGEERQNRVNLFTTNTQILISTLYAKFPKPLVTREFEDQEDKVGRTASTMVERMLKVQPRDDFDTSMRAVIQDRLVPGLGQVWLRYDPIIQTQQVPPPMGLDGLPMGEPQSMEVVTDEKVVTDYVYWEDFYWSPARTWADCRWVARAVPMTKEDVAKRFGDQIANYLPFKKGSVGAAPGQGEQPDKSVVEYARIFEIWDKRERAVVWVCMDCDVILDRKPDPLKRPEFWPCPRPLLALTSTSNMMPRPDFLMAQDQYEELDKVNNKIITLVNALKVVGVYDGSNVEIARIFNEGIENQLISVKGFSEFMERGGMKGSVDWLPIEPIVQTIERLRVYRADLIQQIYEITGISDIMRGASKASETLGAQQLKAQYGSVKLQFLQMETASFVEEALSIKAHIIRTFFQPQNIVRYSNIQFVPGAQEFIDEAIKLIKSPDFELRVQVHADSMAVPEFNAERDSRMEFVRSMAEALERITPMAQVAPPVAAGMLEVFKWAAASFRTGYTIEAVVDKMITQAQQMASAPKSPPPPTPQEQAQVAKDMTQAKLNDARADQIRGDTIISLTEPIEDPNKPDSPPPSDSPLH